MADILGKTFVKSWGIGASPWHRQCGHSTMSENGREPEPMEPDFRKQKWTSNVPGVPLYIVKRLS